MDEPKTIRVPLYKKWRPINHTPDITVLPKPIKPLNDDNTYKTIRLENGLTALLISDPNAFKSKHCDEKDKNKGSSMENSEETILSGCEMDSHDKLAYFEITVNAGSFSDPVEIPGLAHLVEHLLYTGSKKCPSSNDFDRYIYNNFGSASAETSLEMTTYYFSVSRDKLRGALDIISQFYISPLFDKECIKTEVATIEYEYQLGRKENQHDALLYSLYPPDHPCTKFDIGNKVTLHDNIDNETLRRSVIEFWERHYSAHRMTLVLRAGFDIKTLEQYVVEFFGKIRNNGLPSDDFSQFMYENHQNIITENWTKLYYLEPNGLQNQLTLSWMLPTKFANYTENAVDYLEYMLNLANTGSLKKYLKSRHLINDYECYTSSTLTLVEEIYIEFTMTSKGLKHIDQVIEALFSYMEMLKREYPNKRIFNEIKAVYSSRFLYEPSYDEPLRISQNMFTCKPEHYLTCTDVYYNFNPDLISELYEYIKPETMNIIIISSEIDSSIEYDQEERWYGGRYRQEEIPSSWMDRWLHPKRIPYFRFPKKNEYIPDNFDIVPLPKQYEDRERELNIIAKAEKIDRFQAEEKLKNKTFFKKDDLHATVNCFRLDQPNLFRKDDCMEMWYKPNYYSKLPITVILLLMLSPLGLENTKQYCILSIWKEIIKTSLLDNTYDAEFAGIHIKLLQSSRGLGFEFKGYSQHLPKFVEHRLQKIQTNKVKLKDLESARSKIKMSVSASIQGYESFFSNIITYLISDPAFDILEMYNEIDTVTYQDVVNFHEEYFTAMYLKLFVSGNTAWYEALKLSQSIQNIFNYQPLDKDQFIKRTIYQLPPGNNILRIKNLSPEAKVNYVFNFYQGEMATVLDEAILQIIEKELGPALFTELRGRQRLAYGVYTQCLISEIASFLIWVFPTVNSTSYVDFAIDSAIRNFSLINKRRTANKNQRPPKGKVIQVPSIQDLFQTSDIQYWDEIENNRYDFQRHLKVQDALRHLKLSQVEEWYRKFFPIGPSSYFRKLSVQIVGPALYETYVKNNENDDEDLKYEYLGLNQPVPETVFTNKSAFITNMRELKSWLMPMRIQRSDP